MNAIKNKLLLLSSALMLALPMAVPVVVHAAIPDPGSASAANPDTSDPDCTNAKSSTAAIKCGVNNTGNSAAPDPNKIIDRVVNLLSWLVGVIAVIMVIFGGFRYVTSGGDSTRVNGAKNTILYALIGLVIVALAQVIVKFVLDKAT